jgi:hypothetical protein
LKRRIKIAIAIVAYILLIIVVVAYSLPVGIMDDINSIARDDEGNIYGVASLNKNVFVVELDSEGNTIDVSRCKSESDVAEVSCKYSNDTIYVLQKWIDDGTQYFSIWMKGDEETYYTELCHLSLDNDVEISDFYVYGDKVGIVYIDQQTRDIYVYGNELGVEDTQVINTDFIPTDVKYGTDNLLYTLSQDGRFYRLELTGNKTYLGVDDAVTLMIDSKGYYYSQRGDSSVVYTYYNGLVGYSYSNLGEVWDIQSSDVVENLAVLSYVDDHDELSIVSRDESRLQNITRLDMPLWSNIKLLSLPCLLATLIYIVFILGVYLFDRLIFQKKKLRYQTIIVVAAVSFIWLVVINLTLYISEKLNQLYDKMYYLEIYLDAEVSLLTEEVDISSFEYNSYIGSGLEQSVEEFFGKNYIKSSNQKFSRLELVYGYEVPTFVYSSRAVFGRHLDTYYNADVIDEVRKCVDSGSSFCFNTNLAGQEYVIGIVPLKESDNKLCMILCIPKNDGVTVHKDFNGFRIYSVVGWVVMVVLLAIFLRRKWNFVETLVVQMEKVSKGDYRIEKRNVPNNEFGKLWTSLERMGKNIQIRNYRLDGTLDYVNQFAPRNFENLFDRDSLQDIEVGEAIEINATMGIISIIDRNTLLSGSLQRQYVQYVNKLMEILFSQAEAEQAIFLQNGSNLENVKVIFKENGDSAKTAVKYSIECIESLLGLTETKYNTKPFIMLHKSLFNCGLAGGSKQVYPYVTSLEMETLSLFVETFKECNVRMVVTGNAWEDIKDIVNGRYIGYVSSKDGKGSYKIYEIFDAYSQSQRQERMKNCEAFEKALSLYYSNDLYLARSMFSNIVKECPDDGIARWYAFACDEMFNREDNTDAHYELFWGLF